MTIREEFREYLRLDEKIHYDYRIQNAINHYTEKDIMRLMGLHISDEFWLEDKNVNFLGIKCNTNEIPSRLFNRIMLAIGRAGHFSDYLSSYKDLWDFMKNHKLAKGSKTDAYISGELYKWFVEQKLNIQEDIIILNEPKGKKPKSEIIVPDELKNYVDEKGKLNIYDSYNFAKKYNYVIYKNIDDPTITALILYAYKNNLIDIGQLMNDFNVKKSKPGKIIIKDKAIIQLDGVKLKFYDYNTPSAVYDGVGKISSDFNQDILYDIFSSQKDLPKTYLKFIKQNNISKYTQTEHEFMETLFKQLENSKEGYLKKGDINFGIGNVRKDRFDSLVRSGYIEEIQQGPTKYIYLSGTSKENLTKNTLNKLVYSEIKEKLEYLTSMRRYAYVYGINAEDNDITIAYRVALTGMKDKDQYGVPTKEYDNKVQDDINGILEEVNSIRSKYPEYNIKVKHISIFDSFKSNI